MRKHISFIFYLISTSTFATTHIPTVTVKAQKQSIYSITSGLQQTIWQNDIQTTGAVSLTDVLQSLGGVQLIDTTGNGSRVALGMRGFGGNANSNTLLLINGMPITNPDLAPPDLNAIPTYQIKYIQIIAGSESVLYGDQAVGGIINIVTTNDHHPRYELACTGGSYQTRRCYIAINHAYRQLQFNVSAGHYDSLNYRDHNTYHQNIFLGNLDYPYAEGHWHFDYRFANEKMQYPGALTNTQVRADRQQANNHSDFFQNWNDTLHLQTTHALNENIKFKLDASTRKMVGNGVLFSPFTQMRVVNFLRPTLNITHQSLSLLSGIDLEDDRYRLGSAYGVTQDQENKFGLFGVANYKFNSIYQLSFGARAAQQISHLQDNPDRNNINRALATTLGLTYTLNPSVTFYLRRAGSFRFPKADENASTPPNINGLRTQRGIAYESGMRIRQLDYSLKFNIYQLNLRDEIAFDPLQTPEDPFGVNRNLAPTVRHGFSLSGDYRFLKKFRIDGQYDYVRARFQSGINSGNLIPLVAENIFRAGLTYLYNDYLNFYTEALYTGSQYPANDNLNVDPKLGGYTLFNFNINFHYKNLHAALRFNNIFNKAYYLYAAYQSGITYFYPAPEHNILLTVRYVFD